MALRPLSAGIEQDQDVAAALRWLASVSGDPSAFCCRIEVAQAHYASFSDSLQSLSKNPDLGDLGPDLVASFLAQGKSLLDRRRTYDIALASRYIPWIKQLGVNVNELARVNGAAERARRMLADASTAPDGPLLELVMGGNYAAEGLEVAFVPEAPGQAKTPDLHLFMPGVAEPVAIEFKRLRRGRYGQEERARHRLMFKRGATIIDAHRLSLHIDVTYTRELKDVPEGYLEERLSRFLASPRLLPGAYQWRDDFGTGQIKPANLPAVREETRNSSLYLGTKMARLLSGSLVQDDGYHLAAGGEADDRDPRFMAEVRYASVVTWQSTAVESIERKARHVKNRLVEAESQIRSADIGIIHLAMDAEASCESSDLRRERNKQAILEFKSKSLVAALYVHYLVSRVSETHSWLVDETVDTFGSRQSGVPMMMIFRASDPLDNDLPAWKQAVQVPKT